MKISASLSVVISLIAIQTVHPAAQKLPGNSFHDIAAELTKIVVGYAQDKDAIEIPLKNYPVAKRNLAVLSTGELVSVANTQGDQIRIWNPSMNGHYKKLSFNNTPLCLGDKPTPPRVYAHESGGFILFHYRPRRTAYDRESEVAVYFRQKPNKSGFVSEYIDPTSLNSESPENITEHLLFQDQHEGHEGVAQITLKDGRVVTGSQDKLIIWRNPVSKKLVQNKVRETLSELLNLHEPQLLKENAG